MKMTGKGYIHLKSVKTKNNIGPDGKEYAAIVEGRWSSPQLDRGNDVVLPTAFDKHIGEFMSNPIMKYEHDETIGKWFTTDLTPDGPVSRGGIAPTEEGRKVAMLLDYEIVTRMSFMYEIMDWDPGKDGGPNILKELRVFEAGPVSIPMNDDTNIQIAKSHNIDLNETLGKEAARRVRKVSKHMEPKDVEKVVDDKLAVTAGEISKDLKNELAGLNSTIKDLRNTTLTEGDVDEKLDRMEADYKKVTEAIQEEVKALTEKAKIAATRPHTGALDVKTLLHMPMHRAKATFASAPEKAVVIGELQKAHDEVLFADFALANMSKQRGDAYHKLPLKERVKSLKSYGRFNDLIKAMDTTTDGEGADFIESDYSRQLEKQVREPLFVPSQHRVYQMPSQGCKVPLQGNEIVAVPADEKADVVSAHETTEQTPGSDEYTYTAYKMRTRIQKSWEYSERAIISEMDETIAAHADGHLRATELAMINGQKTTQYDTGYSLSGDMRLKWDGFRYGIYAGSDNTENMGTFDKDTLRLLPAKMGKYGRPEVTYYLCSLRTYQKHFLRDLGDDVDTLDKMGPNAVIRSGSLSAFDGRQIITSPYVQDDLDATGIYSASGQDRSILLLIHAPSWRIGQLSGYRFYMEYDPYWDVFQTFAYQERAFRNVFDVTSEVVVAEGFNIS
jgi:HK97 family phage prohead protease